MRPDRAVVKKALSDANGDKTKAAGLLGCSRPTLYTWIYQLGLDRFAGIRQDRRLELDAIERKNTGAGGKKILPVKAGEADSRTLQIVQNAAAIELPVHATVKLPSELWKRARKTAIDRGCTVSIFVESALEQALAGEAKPNTARRERTEGEAGGGGEGE